jgi:hypothetical protein
VAAAREQQSAEVSAQAWAEAQAAVAQQQPWRRQAQAAPVVSSLAAARRPCSDRHAAPAQQRRPESAEVLPVPEQRSVEAEARVQARAALVLQQPSSRRARTAPAASSRAAARTPCSDRQTASVRQRRPEAAAVQAAVAALRRPAAVPALRPPAAVQAVEAAAQPARSSLQRA